MRSLFFVPVSGDVDVAPAFPLPEGRLFRPGATAMTAGYRGTVYGGRWGLPQGAGNIAALSRVTSGRGRVWGVWFGVRVRCLAASVARFLRTFGQEGQCPGFSLPYRGSWMVAPGCRW